MSTQPVPFTLSNFRKEDSIADWPIGRNQRATAVFAHETNKRGQRILRTTTGKPKASTYYDLICLADGSDGKTHLVGYSAGYRMLMVMSADMQHSDYTLHYGQEHYADYVGFVVSATSLVQMTDDEQRQERETESAMLG